MVAQLLAFVAVSMIVIVTPGPDTALTLRNAVAGGRRAGIWTAGGVAAGQLVWTVAASVGVAGLLAASEPAFRAVQLAGAAYLVYLGIRSLRAAWRGAEPVAAGLPATGGGRALREGLVSNLANPKMAVFFVSLLPQFAAPGAGFGGLLLLGMLFCLLTFGWLAAYSVAVDGARRVLQRTGVRRALDGITGVVLVGFGARLALDQR